MVRWLLLALLSLLPISAFAGPNTVAVLYFDNSGGPTYDALKVGLAQMLITDLLGTEGVTVVERAQLQAILDELALGHDGVVDPKTAAKVGKLSGAQWMVLGTYFELGGTLFVQSRLVDVETGVLLEAFKVQGEPSGFLDLEAELARKYEAALRTLAAADPAAPAPKPRTRADDGATGAASPTEVVAPDAKALDAAIAFSEGLILLDGKDVPRAREAFERAVAADPRLDDARDALAALDL